MNSYQGEYDPAYRYDIHHLAEMEPNAVELLLEQGRVPLADFTAATALREAKSNSVSSNLLDLEVYQARKKAEKKLGEPFTPADAVGAVIEACEQAGVLRANHRGGKQ